MFTTFISTLASFFFIPALLGIFPVATAATSDLLSGYAWSPTTGWLSFNCTDGNSTCSAGTNYGVTVSSGAITRDISGYAWSSSLGWITFNGAELVGCPSGTCEAKMTVATGKISGWARACTVFTTGCSGSLKASSELGDWDGWISLSDNTNYGILANGDKWTGYAWGGGRVTGTTSPLVGGNAAPGWISLRGLIRNGPLPTSFYGVTAASAGANAIGPRTISCGVTPSNIAVNATSTWIIAVEGPLLAGPYTYSFWDTASSTGAGFTGTMSTTTATIDRKYLVGGSISGWATVTIAGIPYFVACDGVPLAGGYDPGGQPPVVGTFDIKQRAASTPSGAMQGQNFTVNGLYDSSDDAIVGPFYFAFEFDSNNNGTADEFSTSAPIMSAPASTNSISVTANWTPATSGTNIYRFRYCGDSTNLIAENNESNNCSSWSSLFTVSPPPSFNLDATNDPTISAGPYQAGVTAVTLNGSIICYDGAAADEDCTAPLTQTFDSVFIIDMGVTPDRATADFVIPAAPQVSAVNPPASAPVSAISWVIPESACPFGGPNCTANLKLCADQIISPYSAVGVVSEVGMPGGTGTFTDNNCSNTWVTFTVTPAPAGAPTASCTVAPKLSKIGGQVKWDATAIGGSLDAPTYSWSFNPAPQGYVGGSSPTSEDPIVTYDAIGTKTATVTVTKVSGSSAPTLCTGTVRVQTVTEI